MISEERIRNRLKGALKCKCSYCNSIVDLLKYILEEQ